MRVGPVVAIRIHHVPQHLMVFLAEKDLGALGREDRGCVSVRVRIKGKARVM